MDLYKAINRLDEEEAKGVLRLVATYAKAAGEQNEKDKHGKVEAGAVYEFITEILKGVRK